MEEAERRADKEMREAQKQKEGKEKIEEINRRMEALALVSSRSTPALSLLVSQSLGFYPVPEVRG